MENTLESKQLKFYYIHYSISINCETSTSYFLCKVVYDKIMNEGMSVEWAMMLMKPYYYNKAEFSSEMFSN